VLIRAMRVTLLSSLLLAGCSFQQTLDAIVDEARQAELIATARTLCSNAAALQPQFKPELWSQTQPRLRQLPGQCPPGGGDDWQLTTFRFNSANDVNGNSSRQEYAVLVAGGQAGPWTEVALNYERIGNGPLLIAEWDARRSADMPPSLAYIGNWDSVRTWIALGVGLVLLMLAGLIVWLVRRSRRRGGMTAP
jgi:outer membrane murein-binding lipoprotein Lpp